MAENDYHEEESTKFKKGNPGKPKGSKDKKTAYWNELSTFMVGAGAQKYMEHIQTLKPEEFCKRYETLLAYFKPKLNKVKMSGDEDADPIILQYKPPNGDSQLPSND